MKKKTATAKSTLPTDLYELGKMAARIEQQYSIVIGETMRTERKLERLKHEASRLMAELSDIERERFKL